MDESNPPADDPRPPFMTARVVWDDARLLEMEVRIVTDDGWSGTAQAYADGTKVPGEARALQRWSREPEGEAVIEFGTVDGYDWVRLRFFVADMAVHVACEANLATRSYSNRSLTATLRTEPALVERFARHLASVAETLEGEAVLICV